MKKGIILPLYYFAPVSSFVLAYHFDAIKFFVPGKFRKQSYYQRMYIKSPTGVEKLIIPLKKSGHKTPFKELLPDASVNWHKKHLHSIKQSYSGAAYFFHYFPEIEKILHQNHSKPLHILNEKIYKMLLKELDLSYKLNSEADFWYSVNLPEKKRDILPWFPYKPYYQFFGEFEYDLSILDLLMHYGLESRIYLKEAFEEEFF